MQPVYELTPFTMLDYPNHTACIIWFAGCNFRCPYCHNPEMITAKGTIPMDSILQFLEKRKNRLDAVVMSGGEASSYPDIIKFTQIVKDMGFKVKLDTNGSRPEVIKKLVENNLLDYIALDYKATSNNFQKICGFKREYLFKESLKYISSLKNNNITVEIRTTVHTDLLSLEDVKSMIKKLNEYNYLGTYYVQNYQDDSCITEMPEQKTLLDINELSKLNSSVDFQIEFRNF